jgi:hypothetical protein
MKPLIYILFFLLCTSFCYAQEPTAELKEISAPVGTDNWLAEYEGFYAWHDCTFRLKSILFTNGDSLSDPFRLYNYNGNPLNLFFRPLFDGNWNVSVDASYYVSDGGCYPGDEHILNIKATSYYDSTIKITPYRINYYFRPDTLNKKYYQIYDAEGVRIFNNFPDSAIIMDWALEYDSIAKMKMKILLDSTELPSNTLLSRESYKHLMFSFQSESPALYFHTYTVDTLVFRINHNGKDSSYQVIFLFDFSPLAPNGINVTLPEKKIDIYPNPSGGALKIICSVDKSSYCYLTFFDELGREVQTIYSGFLDVGEHEFTAKLPPGMYYVRMQAGDEVLTRKVTVVR